MAEEVFPIRRKITVEDWVSLPMNTWLQLRIETKLGYQSFGAQMRFMGITISKARPFSHNIGLGATRNPELIKEIGKITAKQVLLTGLI